MTASLVITEDLAAVMHAWLRDARETAGVLLARPVVSTDGDLRLLVTEVVPVPDDAYVLRTRRELRISSGGYVPALRRAEAEGSVPLWLHSHVGEGAWAKPSPLDDRVDEDLREVFAVRTGADLYGSVVVATTDGRLRFTGRLDRAGQQAVIDRLIVVGSRLRVIHSDDMDDEILDPSFDRNVRAFGGGVQRVLGSLRVGIAGCGGTGSAVAEQLIRLGVRRFTLVDHDRLSASNVTRVYGSTPADVGRPKVDVLTDHVRAIAPDAEVASIMSTTMVEATARALGGADVIFGCTDDNAGRLVVSRLSTYLMVPVFDCGVLLSDRGGQIDGIFGRVTVLHPGAGCLVCRGRIDMARAAAEALTPTERQRRADEGYAPALPGIEPAVVAYTTMVAAAAVNELLERLVGYGVEPAPNEVLLRVHDREMSTNIAVPRAGHYCDITGGKVGRGITVPFLEQTWVA